MWILCVKDHNKFDFIANVTLQLLIIRLNTIGLIVTIVTTIKENLKEILMKKLLVVLLSSVSVVAFADSFQEFNNNVYAGYNNTSINEGQFGTANSWTIGANLQTKTNVWVNLEANDSLYNSNYALGGTTYAQALVTGKAGYAFQFFGNDSNGFQVIPYVTYTYGTTMTYLDQYYGLGVKPEYRLLDSLKVSLDITAYDLTQNTNGAVAGVTAGTMNPNPALAGQVAAGYVQDFRYTLNPEVQYDIAKIILVGVGYKYDQSFNKATPNSDGNSTVYAKVGYLF